MTHSMASCAPALNSVAHGIYSVSPVVEEMESKRSWTAYRFAMLDCLAPVGMVEMTLAERITLAAWRLRRVARELPAKRRWVQRHRHHLLLPCVLVMAATPILSLSRGGAIVSVLCMLAATAKKQLQP